jgi:uncharacterized protein YdiU (UPF0061 family)
MFRNSYSPDTGITPLSSFAGGVTMDYGPFGFIEKYSPTWNMWVGGGKHYSFMNQNDAGSKNFETLIRSILPILTTDEERKEAKELISSGHQSNINKHMNIMWCSKLGLLTPSSNNSTTSSSNVDAIVNTLLELMEKTECDWTITWRQLSVIVERMAEENNSMTEDDMFELLNHCFYSNEKKDVYKKEWLQWLHNWSVNVLSFSSSSSASLVTIAASMKRVSPKYIPREWMLVDAYTNAENGNYSTLKELFTLFEQPYENGTSCNESSYYKKQMNDNYNGVGKGGTSFMS